LGSRQAGSDRDGDPGAQAPESGTSLPIGRCCFDGADDGIDPLARDIMATKENGRIVETPTEARQAEPGPSVLALLTISTGLAILILGVIWFAFFRT
jgi:hypothetical protein